MGVIRRGIKNAFRNNVRTFSIVLILAMSIAMSLIMIMSLKTVQSKIDSVKSSIGNVITIAPAGVRGFEGGGELLTNQNAIDVATISNVSSVTRTLSDRLRKEGTAAQTRPGEVASTTTVNNTTNLDSSVNPGSFGNRQRASENGGFAPTGTFAMPITLTGISDLNSVTWLSALGVSQFNVTNGDKIDGNSGENVAMVGTSLAAKNNLSVGSTFTAYGATITVKGIFDAGNDFANATIVMPIESVQTLSAQPDAINQLIITTDSIDNVSTVESAIKTKLGEKVDVTSQQDSSESAIKPLENIKTISLYSLIGSLVAGTIIIFLTMVMIVRERRREIGVLKAIGASNSSVVSQFTVEALVLTITSSVLGVALGTFLSNPILKVLVSNSESTTQTADVTGGRGPQGMMRIGANIGMGAQNAVRDLHTVIGWEILLYGLFAAIIIAIIGSALPAYFIAKVRPAEVMRTE